MEKNKDVYFDYHVMSKVERATRKQHSPSTENEQLPEQKKKAMTYRPSLLYPNNAPKQINRPRYQNQSLISS
jgi:hypothetical protein